MVKVDIDALLADLDVVIDDARTDVLAAKLERTLEGCCYQYGHPVSNEAQHIWVDMLGKDRQEYIDWRDAHDIKDLCCYKPSDHEDSCMDTQRTENLNLHHYYASWYAPGSLDYLLYSLRPPKDYRIGTVLLPDGRSAFRSLDFKMYIVGRQHQRADRRLAYFGRFRGDHTAYESAKALYYWYHG